MRIDQHRDRELARRKGFARRTVIQSVWLMISAVATYLFVRYLMANDFLSYDLFYNRLLIPRWLPEWVIMLVLVLAGVILLQFFFFLAFAFVRPEGRAQTGRPTAHSRNKDPLDDEVRN